MIGCKVYVGGKRRDEGPSAIRSERYDFISENYAYYWCEVMVPAVMLYIKKDTPEGKELADLIKKLELSWTVKRFILNTFFTYGTHDDIITLIVDIQSNSYDNGKRDIQDNLRELLGLSKL